jgi:hypothetical protein
MRGRGIQNHIELAMSLLGFLIALIVIYWLVRSAG